MAKFKTFVTDDQAAIETADGSRIEFIPDGDNWRLQITRSADSEFTIGSTELPNQFWLTGPQLFIGPSLDSSLLRLFTRMPGEGLPPDGLLETLEHLCNGVPEEENHDMFYVETKPFGVEGEDYQADDKDPPLDAKVYVADRQLVATFPHTSDPFNYNVVAAEHYAKAGPTILHLMRYAGISLEDLQANANR